MGEKIQYSYINPPSNSRGGGWGCLQNKQNRRRMTTYNCAPLRHPLLGDMLHGNLKSHRKEYNVSVNYRGHTSCFLTERTRELRNTPLSWRHMQDQNIDPPPLDPVLTGVPSERRLPAYTVPNPPLPSTDPTW